MIVQLYRAGRIVAALCLASLLSACVNLHIYFPETTESASPATPVPSATPTTEPAASAP